MGLKRCGQQTVCPRCITKVIYRFHSRDWRENHPRRRIFFRLIPISLSSKSFLLRRLKSGWKWVRNDRFARLGEIDFIILCNQLPFRWQTRQLRKFGAQALHRRATNKKIISKVVHDVDLKFVNFRKRQLHIEIRYIDRRRHASWELLTWELPKSRNCTQ